MTKVFYDVELDHRYSSAIYVPISSTISIYGQSASGVLGVRDTRPSFLGRLRRVSYDGTLILGEECISHTVSIGSILVIHADGKLGVLCDGKYFAFDEEEYESLVEVEESTSKIRSGIVMLQAELCEYLDTFKMSPSKTTKADEIERSLSREIHIVDIGDDDEY